MLKIVIVEDEELLRMGLTTFIKWEELGFEPVGEAGDGRKALQLIREKKPDVIITDIKMPHMDGIEMTEILKAEMPELRIIIISGYDEFEYAKRALQAGVSEYISKPIKMDHLKEVICKVRDDLIKHRKQREDTADHSIGEHMIQFMNYDTSNLCFEIKSGSKAGIERALQDLKDNLSKQNITSCLQLVLVISNIYYVLVKIPEEAGGNISDVIGNPQDYYQKLIGKMKRDDMVEELGDFCMNLHQYFMDLSMNRKQEIMKRIDLYLQEHFSEEGLSMKDVADFAYVSVSYLGMIIKKETDKTFTEYLTDIRMEKAKQYLVTTSMKNYEVAEACGYSTPAYFSTVFKGACGVTPTEYRNMSKKKDEK